MTNNEANAPLAQPEPEGPTDEELDALERKFWKLDSVIEYEAGEGFTEVFPKDETFDHRAFARAALAHYARPAIHPVPVAEREEVTGNQTITRALIAVSGGLCYFTADAKHAQLLTVQKILLEALRPEPEPEWPTEEAVEAAADVIYGSMRFDRIDSTVPWVERGNSFAQDEARRCARAVLSRYARPAIQPVPVAEHPWEREGWRDAEGICWWFHKATPHTNAGWIPATHEDIELVGVEFFSHSLPHHALPIPQPTQPTQPPTTP